MNLPSEDIMKAPRVVSPFDRASTTEDVLAGIDLSGKTAIVTGGSSGLGIETARALARAGALVRLAVRDLAAGEKVAAELNEEIGDNRVDAGKLDLADLSSVEAFARAWGDAPLSLLINNAGVMACPRQSTVDGFEYQFGTNHLGHFYLTALLLPALEAGAPARVIALSSSGHQASGVDLDDINYREREYHPFRAYGQSKTANALFAVELDRRFRDKGIRAFSVMPGVIETNLGRHMTDELKAQLGIKPGQADAAVIFYKSLSQGAATSVWAATSPQLEGYGGLYLENCNQAPEYEPGIARGTGVMRHATDPEIARKLWEMSAEMIRGVRSGVAIGE